MELGTRRRGGSGGDWVRKRGLQAVRGRGEAIGGVFRGGAGLEWRVHGGPELASVQWASTASRRWPPGQPRAAAALNSGGDRTTEEQAG